MAHMRPGKLMYRYESIKLIFEACILQSGLKHTLRGEDLPKRAAPTKIENCCTFNFFGGIFHSFLYRVCGLSPPRRVLLFAIRMRFDGDTNFGGNPSRLGRHHGAGKSLLAGPRNHQGNHETKLLKPRERENHREEDQCCRISRREQRETQIDMQGPRDIRATKKSVPQQFFLVARWKGGRVGGAGEWKAEGADA